jgi:hypothetical protein
MRVPDQEASDADPAIILKIADIHKETTIENDQASCLMMDQDDL